MWLFVLYVVFIYALNHSTIHIILLAAYSNTILYLVLDTPHLTSTLLNKLLYVIEFIFISFYYYIQYEICDMCDHRHLSHWTF